MKSVVPVNNVPFLKSTRHERELFISRFDKLEETETQDTFQTRAALRNKLRLSTKALQD